MGEPAIRELGTGDLGEFRRTGHALVDAVADHLAALPGRPVWQPLPDDLRVELLSLPLPGGPTGLGPLAGIMAREVLPYAMGNGHPAFFGWVNPPPSLAGVLASLPAAAMNPSIVSGDHADVHLERTAVRWLAELVGYPHAPGAGLLTSGASAATIVCLAGARGRAAAAAGCDVRRVGLAGGPPLLSYVPSEAHSCVRRAIELLGLGSESIRPVPLSGGRLDPNALRAAIAADRAAGGAPALLVGSAGTVNTGAIDPLEDLADVAAAEGLWFHVDGAYGAFGVLDPAIAARYRGMERADSLTLDPYKWLGVPVDAGCALVRRADELREAFSTVPPYLRQDAGAEVGTFAESDPIDALNVARAALQEGLESFPVAHLDGPELDVRLLVDHRERLVRHRVELNSTLQWHLHDLWPELQLPGGALFSKKWSTRIGRRLARAEQTMRVRIARDELRRLRELTVAINQLEREITELIEQIAPQLLDQPGFGPLIAAKLVGEIAGAHRFATPAKLARAAGVAPIPASSGNTQRQRLDQGGNRQINAALHRVIVTRARCHPQTRDYIARRRSEGKTTREAIRCLKRYLVRRVWHLLRAAGPVPDHAINTSIS